MRTRTARDYTPDDHALFAAYREHRALVRPHQCTHDPERCWVEHGPPAIATNGPRSPCLGCGANPRTLRSI